MKHRYAFKTEKENIVKTVGRDVGISTKQAIEICTHIKGKPVKKAITLLENVVLKKAAIPFRRFTEGAGHQKGMGAAKYPLNASKQFIALLKALEANAQNKGLSSDLKIIHACAQKAAEPAHYGRKRGIKMKRTHIELAAEELETKKDKDKDKDKDKKEDKEKNVKKAKQEKQPAPVENKPAD
jgi:large subunit ribosomal protein L22